MKQRNLLQLLMTTFRQVFSSVGKKMLYIRKTGAKHLQDNNSFLPVCVYTINKILDEDTRKY